MAKGTKKVTSTSGDPLGDRDELASVLADSLNKKFKDK